MKETTKLNQLTNEALAELFLSMAMKEENLQEAEKAFAKFYNLYKNYLYTVAKKVCKNWTMYGDDLIQDVHQNTFLTVYENAENFIQIEDVPFERQERHLKAWLGTIAKNEMLQLLREQKENKEKTTYLPDLSYFDDKEIESTLPISENVLLVEKALNSLTERDRDILITYLMFEDGNKKLPSEEIQRLADIWDVHPDNMRQIKKRSIEKVKKYIETYKQK
jgi:RNA polymerase sigma factor (sigma-70 family)